MTDQLHILLTLAILALLTVSVYYLFFSHSRRPFRLLCLDGGGVRGIVEAVILHRIATDCQKTIPELFDMVIGTSTGAIMAVALGVLQKTPSECRQLYEELCERVFPEYVGGTVHRLAAQSIETRTNALYEQLKNCCKDNSGGQTSMQRATDGMFVATVCDSKALSPPALFVLRNYAPPRHLPELRRYAGSDPNVDAYKAWEAAAASASVPFLFKQFQKDRQWLVDGGLLANNPTEVGINEVEKMIGRRIGDVKGDLVVSIGTGLPPANRPTEWRLVPKIFSDIAETADDLLKLTTETKQTHGRVQSLLHLQNKYFRADPYVQPVNLDESASLDYLVNITEEWLNIPDDGREKVQELIGALQNSFQLVQPKCQLLQQVNETGGQVILIFRRCVRNCYFFGCAIYMLALKGKVVSLYHTFTLWPDDSFSKPLRKWNSVCGGHPRTTVLSMCANKQNVPFLSIPKPHTA